ncbi:hypothetical protein [Sorangium sp. So ce388]|uniref:hypothetical protein n=1 Tax=Sorangium sp. So ce388 TaxID=3133309 RepID=UPI003F5C13BB
MSSTSNGDGTDLDQDRWRSAYQEVSQAAIAAWSKRCEAEQIVRRIEQELDAAKAVFAASDAEAKGLCRRVEDMLEAGKRKGFRP